MIPGTGKSAWSGGQSGDLERFVNALATAARLHQAQYRKGTSIPYISHLLGTCAIALEYGADADQAIASLLHDVIEDIQPTAMARAEVATFGREVLRIVEACTDADSHPKPPWRQRKEAYVGRLTHEGARVLLVSASDKLHNARAIVRDLRDQGPSLWTRFDPNSDQLWYYGALVDAFASNPESPARLIDELARTVRLMTRLAATARPVDE